MVGLYQVNPKGSRIDLGLENPSRKHFKTFSDTESETSDPALRHLRVGLDASSRKC